MSMKSVLLRFAAAGAIALSAVAVAVPANAASAPSPKASISASVSPAGATGAQLCTSNGVFCLQRVTNITNGSAYVDIWANTITWTGWFELRGPDGHMANYPSNGVKTFGRGGVGTWLPDIPAGKGYEVIAWQNIADPVSIGQINFSV